MSTKELVLNAIHRLPDDANLKDVAEEIAFLVALQEGDEDLKQGKILSNEEMKKRLDSWLSK
jgi:hypothetical protein